MYLVCFHLVPIELHRTSSITDSGSYCHDWYHRCDLCCHVRDSLPDPHQPTKVVQRATALHSLLRMVSGLQNTVHMLVY